jgi:hypothetical protein
VNSTNCSCRKAKLAEVGQTAVSNGPPKLRAVSNTAEHPISCQTESAVEVTTPTLATSRRAELPQEGVTLCSQGPTQRRQLDKPFRFPEWRSVEFTVRIGAEPHLRSMQPPNQTSLPKCRSRFRPTSGRRGDRPSSRRADLLVFPPV